MEETPITRTSLLMRLRDRTDKEAWSNFTELYAPLVYGFLRKRGLQDADAADLTQEAMISVAGAIDSFSYDRPRGSFRRWLFTIVQNGVCDFWRRSELGTRGPGGTQAYEILMAQPQSSNGEATEWDQVYERHLFQVAAQQVRKDFQESSWLAFWQTAIEDRSPKEVADDLGMSVAAVYMSKRRVIARIRKRVTFLQGDAG